MNSESDFIALRHISTWAVSGIRKIHNENDLRAEGISWDASHISDREIAQDPSPGPTSASINGTQLERSEGRLFCDAPEDPLLPWSAKWKEEIGRRAKAVLETGRARHLALLGLSTRVIEYVSPEVTPENLLILGISQ
ncbi:hypothetical protein KIN20_014876 [Parelaphostrongylus tenuis]|uniref:tRNA:m(4)X modification enzyme TRM13 n=1 Tax=Parelaphostrongylus tenuis TaxID=148309 RepID=A0AAD5QNM0_PARTN|nr:hypothetical protein KIN20_014876 [Parelaphostrongylus tenuis]